jgi:ribosomal protein S12 methylthiotransferase accessory factor
MSGALAPPAASVPESLAHCNSDLAERGRVSKQTSELVDALLRRRRQFGITRVGCITRLDRIGMPVVQVARPLALSNAIHQGKGMHLAQAAAAALMEALETWAAESIPSDRSTEAPLASCAPVVQALYKECVIRDASADWDRVPLCWMTGWNLFTAAEIPVPTAMVDTAYTLPSPHPAVFPRTTTGLAAGSTILQAIVHAGLEILERDAVAQAHCTPHFFDRSQIDLDSIRVGLSAEILRRIDAAKLVVGIWRVPADHPLPVYWCHLMENDADQELVPLPAEGFGCDFTHDGALARALLEACQARLAAISGAREDITRRSYPRDYDREHLAEWRQHLASPARSVCLPAEAGPKPVGATALDTLLGGLQAAGAKAAIVVPLFRDEFGIDVIRMVAPPLRHGRHHNVR